MFTLNELLIDEDGNQTVGVAILGCESLDIIEIYYRRAKHPVVLMDDDVEIERNR